MKQVNKVILGKVMTFSLDKALCFFVLSMLPLLFLPDFMLLSWKGLTLGLLISLILSAVFYVRKKTIAVYFLYLCFILTGIGISHYQATSLLSQADQLAYLPKKIQTDLTVVEILHQQSYQTVIATAKLQPHLAEQRIYVQWRTDDKVQLGERWRAQLNVRPISSRLNFAGFDRQAWMLAKKVTAWGAVKSAVKISEDSSWYSNWRATLVRQTLQQTQHLSMQGLLMALGFGERAWLKVEHWEPYQQTNSAHLIAISGLHIGLAMALGFYLARLVQIVLPTSRIGPIFPILAGLLFAAGYAELAGFTIPTFRAIVALLILYTFRLKRLYYTPWQYLLRVVALLLLCDPMMILSSSFWLSLGAVTALILHYQYFPFSMLYWRGKPVHDTGWRKVRYVLGLFHLQLGLLLFFTPVQLFIFNGLSLNSLWANLLAVPIFSLLLVPVILFAILTQGAFNSWLFADWIAQHTTTLITPLQNQWVSFSFTQIHFMNALLCGFFGLLLYGIQCQFQKQTALQTTALSFAKVPTRFHLYVKKLPPNLRKTYVVTFLLCLLNIGWGSYSYFYTHHKDRWFLDTLDIGQGLATLIVKQGRGILYDTGSRWQGGSMAELEIIPYLKREGIQLDKLIISHDDNDHSGGVNTILRHYPEVELIQPSRKKYQKTHRTFCQQGLNWRWQGLDFKVLSPHKIVERAYNTDSCIILLSDGKHKVLLTGDADVAAENKILSQLEKIDVLQVGHHGSNTSTGDALLKQTKPRISLISSGRWNPWGFPHSAVVKRLERAGSAMYNSAELGQIRLVFDVEGISINTARQDFSPWYRRLIGRNIK